MDTPEPTTAELIAKVREFKASLHPGDWEPDLGLAWLVNRFDQIADRLAASEARAVKAEGERDELLQPARDNTVISKVLNKTAATIAELKAERDALAAELAAEREWGDLAAGYWKTAIDSMEAWQKEPTYVTREMRRILLSRPELATLKGAT